MNRRVVWASIVLAEVSLIANLWADQPSGLFGRKPRPPAQQSQRLVPVPAEAGKTKQADATSAEHGGDKVIPASKTTVQAATAAAVSVVSTLPKVMIETVTPTEINVGKTAPFLITVNNNGETTASGVILRTSLPTTAELRGAEPIGEILDKEVQFALGELPPKSEKKVRLEFVPRKPGPIQLASTVSFSVSSQSSLVVRQPQLAVACIAPEEAMHGSVINMKVKVTNVGDGPAEDITVSQVRTPGVENAVLSGLPAKIEGLGAGQSQEIDFEIPASATGNVHASVIAHGAGELEAKSAIDVRIRRPMLEVAAEGPTLRYAQRIGNYYVKVSNPGDAPATNVSVVVQIPSGMQLTAIDRRATFNKEQGTLSWELAQVDAGATVSLQYRTKGIAEGEHRQPITASADHGLKAEAVQITRVESIADVAMSIIDTAGPIEVGGTVEYQIEIKNRGTKSAEQVRITASLPTGLKGIVDEEDAEYKVQGSVVEFTPIAELPVGSEKVLRFKAIGRESGDHTVRITLKSESISKDLVTEESTLFYSGDADPTGK